MNAFSFDGIFMRALNFIADIVLMHLLWLLCSLPIFTIGASTTALYYTCMKRIRTREGYIASNFFRSFKENFKQSTIIWLIMLVIGGVMFTDIRYGLYLNNTMGKAMIISCSVFLIPYLLVLLYIFPIQAKFENTIKDNLKNAFLMAIRHFGYTLLLVILWGMFIVLLMFLPFVGFAIICGAGAMAYVTSTVFIQIFRKYLPDELEEDLEKTGEVFHE